MPEELSPENAVENKIEEVPTPPPASNTKLMVMLVGLVVVGFSAAAGLIGYMYAAKTIPSSKTTAPSATTQPVASVQPSQTPVATSSPRPTLAPNQHGKTFSSQTLGCGFYYAPTMTGSNDPIQVTEKENTIYVYAQGSAMESGQYVRRFMKDPTQTLEQAVTAQLLPTVSSDKCFVKVLSQKDAVTTATIDYPVPANADEPFFAYGTECPDTYKRTNGMSYFYYDAQVPDRFYFFSIGQYGINAYSNDTKTMWQDTFKAY